MANHRTIWVLSFVALLAVSCAGSTPETPATAAESSSTTTSTTATSAPSTPEDGTEEEVEDADLSPVEVQFNWIVSGLSDPRLLTTEAVEEHFSPAFLNQVPASQISQLAGTLAGLAEPPYTVEQFDFDDAGLSGQAIVVGVDARRLTVDIAVSARTPNLIEGLFVGPAELDFPILTSANEVEVALAEFGPQHSLSVYEVTGGECAAIHEIRPGEQIVLGSVFKLWVLAALADEIDNGRASWDETVMVTDELRSSPDGEIFPLETGTEVSLRRLAELMISISDNTATDILINRVGRETVEAAIERAGVADPSLNTPLLSTSNLFTLKFAPQEPNTADYRALDQDGRRGLLEELDASVIPWLGLDPADLIESENADGIPIGEPRDLDLEWFATADDLCRTMVHLDELASVNGLEPVAAAMEINPGGGLPFDRGLWPTIRFKGGSEPGVVAGVWWFEGADGEQFVVAGGVSNPDEALDELSAVLTLASAIQLVE